ncbi:uncharacterized protein [Elaeis guineensis]|uniref:uncharacterized protein n=1 Tax=Elaeis guineensis var. tenera TaxID=51953 RepID=UPI003C6CCD55
MSSSNPLARILDTNRLTGTNYKNWLQNLRIVLNSEKLTHVLDQEAPELPARLSADQRATLEKWINENNKAKCYILASMSNDLQQQHEDMRNAKEMLILQSLPDSYGQFIMNYYMNKIDATLPELLNMLPKHFILWLWQTEIRLLEYGLKNF